MTEIHGFEMLAKSLKQIAERYESGTSRQPQDPDTAQYMSPDDTKDIIGEAIASVLRGDVKESAETRAEETVPSDSAKSVFTKSRLWNKHYIGSNDDIFTFHEFGTGLEAEHPDYPGTVNAPNGGGYVIPSGGYDEHPFGPDDIPGMDELDFKYVVHSGVEANKFIHNAVREHLPKFEQEIADELERHYIDASDI